MKIDYSKRATADLRQVSADSREVGEAVAAAVESRIQQAIASLTDHPKPTHKS